ncbi:MAG: clostripain-related cysteine peptidase [candidate division WOR-3 bacterium]
MWLLSFLIGAQWTVMVYLNGDNNLETYGIRDFNEMEAIGSTSEINIIVQFDRAVGYNNSNGDWTTCRRYYVTHDNDPNIINSELIEDIGEVDMGAPSTLAEFGTWVKNNYPANHYLLIIWNHGDGWRGGVDSIEPIKGISYDESSGNEISVARGELRQALFQIGYVDVLGFDACLMQMWEVMVNISPYAGYMVGSEETEPADGWYYAGFLQDLTLNPAMSPSDLGKSIVNSTSQPTLSAVDLSAITELNTKIDTFALELMRARDQGYTNTINSVRSATQNFYEYSHIDLYDFARRIKSASLPDYLKNVAQLVINGVDEAVIEKHNTYADAYGIAIYHPSKPTYYDNSYSNLEVADLTVWDEYLRGCMYNDSMGIYGGIGNWAFIDTIQYDGAPYSFWGYPDDPPFYAGVRFYVVQPCTVTGVIAFMNHEFNYQLLIYDTDEYGMPNEIIHSQSGVSHHCWNYIGLNSPVVMESKGDFWVIIYTQNAYYPIGVDNGNWAAHRSYVSLDGESWEEPIHNGKYYNFNIRAEVRYYEETPIKETAEARLKGENLKLLVYPNPFKNHCVIKFQIPSTKSQIPNNSTFRNPQSEISLKIYDVAGRVVKSFNPESCILNHTSGIIWSGNDDLGRRLPAGVYFVRLESGDYKQIEKVVLLK